MKRLLFVLLLAGTATLRLQAQDSTKPVIAIMSFTSPPGQDYASVAASVQSAVESGFVKSKRFTLVERAQIDQLVNEMKLQETMSENAAAELGKTVGAQTVVMGLIQSVGQRDGVNLLSATASSKVSIAFELRVVDVATGQIKAAEQITVGDNSGMSGNSGAAYSGALQQIPPKMDDFIRKNFPVAIDILGIKEEKGGKVTVLEVLAGSSLGLKVGDALQVQQVVVRKVGTRTITTYEPVADLRVERISGTETSNCRVLKGGDVLKAKLAANAQLQVSTGQ